MLFNVIVTFDYFCNIKRRIKPTQEVTRVVKYSGRNFRQGTRTWQSYRSMTIHAISQHELQLGQYFRRYREFVSLHFLMLFLCYCYVLFYAYVTHIMIIQRRDVTWFYASRSVLYLSKEVVLCYYYAYMFIAFSDDVRAYIIFYASMRKHCHVTVILSHWSIFPTDSLLYWILGSIRIFMLSSWQVWKYNIHHLNRDNKK